MNLRWKSSRGALVLALAFALCWCALILFVHRESPRSLVSAHGLLHTAIAERYAPDAPVAGGGSPPENPLFAGERLPYYYFFHQVAAALARGLGLDPIHAFELLGLAAAGMAALVAFGLCARLFRSRAAGVAGVLLFFSGCLPQGPLVLLARCLEEGRFALAGDGQYLWGLVHPANAAMRIGDYYGTLGPLFSFFLNVTARPVALALVLALALMLHAVVTARHHGALLGLAGVTILCTQFSAITGVAAAGGLAAALCLVAFALRRSIDRELPLNWSMALVVALVLGAAFGIVGSLHLVGRADAQVGFHWKRLVGMASSAWLLVLLALAGVRRLTGPARAFAVVLVVAALLLCVPTVLFALPVGNEDNFFHVALALLAIPAAGCVVPPHGARWGTGLRLFLLHVAFLPPLAVIIFSYTGRPPLPIAFREGRLDRLPAGGPEARLYSWLRTQTRNDAIVVQDPGAEGRRCTGNTSELPAFTGRCLFTDYASHYLVTPHPDAPRRAAITRALVHGDPLPAEAAGYLGRLGRPIYVVTWDADAATLARIGAQLGPPLFTAPGVSVFEWKGS